MVAERRVFAMNHHGWRLDFGATSVDASGRKGPGSLRPKRVGNVNPSSVG